MGEHIANSVEFTQRHPKTAFAAAAAIAVGTAVSPLWGVVSSLVSTGVLFIGVTENDERRPNTAALFKAAAINSFGCLVVATGVAISAGQASNEVQVREKLKNEALQEVVLAGAPES